MPESPGPPETAGNQGENTPKRAENPLTCIRTAYTLAATPEYAGEVDKLIVKHFMETLAEIALSVAARRIAGQVSPEVKG